MTITKYLIKVYGINRSRIKDICRIVGISPKANVRLLPAVVTNRLARFVQGNYVIGNRLKHNIHLHIKKKVNLRSYQGKRISNKLPVRGQRTRTNAKTQKRMVHYYEKKNRK